MPHSSISPRRYDIARILRRDSKGRSAGIKTIAVKPENGKNSLGTGLAQSGR
jgi:hypothetical protein